MGSSPEFYGKGTSLTEDALNTDLAAEDIYHPLHQGQTQTVALGGVGGIALIEFLKNMLPHLRFDAAAGIAYGHDHLICLGFQADADGAALGGEFAGKVLYGVFAALVLGVGMCMILVWGLLLPGIGVGIAGIVLLLMLIPMCLGLK